MFRSFFMAKINQVSPEKQELFKKLIKEYDLKTAADLQNMLKEMFAPMLQNMLEAELDNSLGYDRYEHTEEIQPNSRNGHSQKTVTTSMGDVEIAIPSHNSNKKRNSPGINLPEIH